MLTVDFRLFRVRGGERVLDVGCGPGRHSWYVCKLDHCSVHAMDYDLESLQKARYMFGMMDKDNLSKGRWNVLRGDAMKMPFKDGTFDKIICSEVLEHVVDDEQGVRELVRVLKDDGEVAVSVPAYLPETICWGLSEKYHTNPGGHIRIYRQQQLIELLCRNGLAVHAVRHKHAYHSVYWILRCAFGVRNERAAVPALYRKFLTWDMEKKYPFFESLEGALDGFFAKSVVVYLKKDLNRPARAAS